MELVIEDMVGATGLELKSDPGVPFVYAGFGGMMVRCRIPHGTCSGGAGIAHSTRVSDRSAMELHADLACTQDQQEASMSASQRML